MSHAEPAAFARQPAPSTQRHRRVWLQGLTAAALWPRGATSAIAARAAARPAPTSTGTTLPLRVLLLSNATYRYNAALTNPPRGTALLAQAFQARGAQVRTLGNLSA